MIEKIKEKKMKLGSKVTFRKTGKTKVDLEFSAKSGISAKRKRVEEVLNEGQGDDIFYRTSRGMTVVMMVPTIFLTVLISASYKTKRSE